MLDQQKNKTFTFMKEYLFKDLICAQKSIDIKAKF